jgi:hypothetical protein
MSLTEAIDRVVIYVRKHPERMTRAEIEEFRGLAEDVYLLAFRVGLDRALPQVPEMRPQVESNEPALPPVQFESKLNLPGDWDMIPPCDDDGLPTSGPLQPVFLVCASPRWFHDMATVRKLAEAQNKKRAGRPRSREARGVDLVEGALIKHHEYQEGGSVGIYEAASLDKLHELCGMSKATISRFLKDKFGKGKGKGGYEEYKTACARGHIGHWLAKWQGDLSEEFLERLVAAEIARGQQEE